MRIATVVLPVPGLPVKDMCSEGDPATRPSCLRARSMSSSAAMSRTRAFTGLSPISSRSSSSRTSLDVRVRDSALHVDALADVASSPIRAADIARQVGHAMLLFR